MNDIDVLVAFVALSENRSRIWLSLLLFFRAIFFNRNILLAFRVGTHASGVLD